MKTHNSATPYFSIYSIDPDTLNIVVADSQKKIAMIYILVEFLLNAKMCTAKQVLLLVIHFWLFQRVLKPFEFTSNENWNLNIQNFES